MRAPLLHGKHGVKVLRLSMAVGPSTIPFQGVLGKSPKWWSCVNFDKEQSSGSITDKGHSRERGGFRWGSPILGEGGLKIYEQ